MNPGSGCVLKDTFTATTASVASHRRRGREMGFTAVAGGLHCGGGAICGGKGRRKGMREGRILKEMKEGNEEYFLLYQCA